MTIIYLKLIRSDKNPFDYRLFVGLYLQWTLDKQCDTPVQRFKLAVLQTALLLFQCDMKNPTGISTD